MVGLFWLSLLITTWLVSAAEQGADIGVFGWIYIIGNLLFWVSTLLICDYREKEKRRIRKGEERRYGQRKVYL